MQNDVGYETEQLKISTDKLEALLSTGESNELVRDSLYVKIHDIYSGIERILRYLLVSRHKINLRKESWHSDILQHAFSLKIIDDDEFKYLRMTVAFRHRFRNGYAHQIEFERLIPVAKFLLTFSRKFLYESLGGI